MTRTEADFAGPIAEDYGSDEPRMVFADWLLETGQGTRAELIRVQCAVARAEHQPRTPEINRLYDRQTQLRRFVDAVEGEVSRGLPGRAFVRFERGLLQTVSVDAENFASAAATIVERVPLFMKLDLRCKSGSDLRAVVAVPELRRARSLEIDAEDGEDVSAEDLAILLDAFKTARLYGLDIRQTRLSDDAVAVLAGHRACRELRDLTLSTISHVGAATLARSKTLARLDRVTLYRIGQARGAKALERASWLASIRWLRLHKQAVTESALAGLRQRLGDRFQLYPIAT
jgi:uncharacterized protein (TIGR02996 family)